MIAKYNRPVCDIVAVLLVVIRLPTYTTDILISVNHPMEENVDTSDSDSVSGTNIGVLCLFHIGDSKIRREVEFPLIFYFRTVAGLSQSLDRRNTVLPNPRSIPLQHRLIIVRNKYEKVKFKCLFHLKHIHKLWKMNETLLNITRQFLINR